MSATAEPQGFTGGHNPWAVALTVTLATFMEVLDTSIANVSLPHIAGNLSVSQDESTWVLTSYLVSNAVVLPVSGWLASRFGRKRFYMSCVVVFTASSFLCGVAPSLGALVFFRVLQGLGGGGLGPSEQAILADTFPPSRRGMAFAVYGMAVVLAPAIGPTLGGWITDHFSWRWVFFINVPVGIASLLLSSRMVVDPPWIAEGRSRAGSIDYVGLGLVAVGLGALEYVLDKGQEDDWFASRTITAFAIVAAAALLSFVLWERRQEHPVVDVRMFRSRSFATANVLMVVLGMALYGSTVLLPQYVQVWMGWTAEQAGKALSPGALVVIALLPLVGRLVSKVDTRWLIAFGCSVLAASLFHMAHTLSPGIDFRTAVLLRAYQSIGLAFLFIPINTVAYVGVPPEKNNAVSGIINLSRNLGGQHRHRVRHHHHRAQSAVAPGEPGRAPRRRERRPPGEARGHGPGVRTRGQLLDGSHPPRVRRDLPRGDPAGADARVPRRAVPARLLLRAGGAARVPHPPGGTRRGGAGALSVAGFTSSPTGGARTPRPPDP
ncbi:MAG TPA: DHA2 family efflux MFS transporter permease subunit [Anaeromyxobacter sp.]|nr:DHA2 family efflux MFS transporter permease subunit [Anaeromyxobacter sp.]